MISLNYNVPISESAFVGNDFVIAGTAINATITSNNHKFLSEELKKSAQTLIGVPLLVDHENKVENIKGRVFFADYDQTNERVPFKARVMDENCKAMIRDGRLNSVSVGAVVESVEEDNGVIVPHGITFKELSLVAVPADSAATFQIAMKEAYDKSHSSILTKTEQSSTVTAVAMPVEVKGDSEKVEPIASVSQDTNVQEKMMYKCKDCNYQSAKEIKECPKCGGKMMPIEEEKADVMINNQKEVKMSETQTTEVVDQSKVLSEKLEAMEKKLNELAEENKALKVKEVKQEKAEDEMEENDMLNGHIIEGHKSFEFVRSSYNYK